MAQPHMQTSGTGWDFRPIASLMRSVSGGRLSCSAAPSIYDTKLSHAMRTISQCHGTHMLSNLQQKRHACLRWGLCRFNKEMLTCFPGCATLMVTLAGCETSLTCTLPSPQSHSAPDLSPELCSC